VSKYRIKDVFPVGTLLKLREKYSVPEKYRIGPPTIFLVVEFLVSPNPRRPNDSEVVLLAGQEIVKFPIGTCIDIFETVSHETQ
jgi:hypothetical protein